MGKVLKGVAIAAAFVALAYATGGLSVVAAGTAGAATVAGVTFTTTFLGGMLVSMAAASILTGISQQFLGAKMPKTQLSRLNVSLDPSTPRKVVFGTTAMPLDLRYHESSGTDQEYIDYIVAVAAHKVTSIDEIWFEEKQAWTAAGGVTGTYAGYLTVTTRTEGSAANYISINGGTKWGSSRRLTGCAYVHLRIKRTGNTKKAESPLVGGLPSRVTIIGNGAALYDPRKDSTVPGGSGSHRATDQSTWGAYTNADDTDNPALQLLWWMLGWEINNKLSVGCGIPYNRIDMASFITAANICDENVTLAIGGTQKRYRSSGTASDGDDRSDIINNLLISMNGTLRDNGGKLTLVAMKNDLASYVLTFSESDIYGGFDWQQTRGLTENYNIIRGRYVDPSPNSLYQMVDYPEIGFAASDGIERVMSVDLPYVEDGRRAQRLAKQILQRNQYRGMFSTTFNAKALGCQVGDVVRLNLETLGWVNKPFRVVSQEIRFDGQVPMALIEENAAIYAWDAEDVAPITPTAPTIYNPLNNPFILGLADVEAVADGKIDSFYQATAPAVASEGDYWTDTDDSNKLYRYTTGVWTLIRDTGIPTAISAAAGAQATADGKVTTFYVETTPTAIAVGDLWYKPSTKYLTRWNGTAWADVATVGAKAGTNLLDSTGATLADAAIITSQGTAANITGQAATATSSDFSVITGTTKPANNATVGAVAGTDLKDSGGTVLSDAAIKNSQQLWTEVSGTGRPADNATTDLLLTSIGSQAMTVIGNTATTAVGTYNSCVRGPAQGGPCYAEVDIPTSGYAMVGLGPSATDSGFSTQSIFFEYAQSIGTLYRVKSGVGAGVSVGTGKTGKLAVAWDGVKFRVFLGGTDYTASFTTMEGTSVTTLYPKWWAYTANQTITGLRVTPFTDNAWDSVGGTGRPENNATVGARSGTNLFRTDGTTVLTQAEIRTVEGTAAAIAGQGAFATLQKPVGILTQPTANLVFNSGFTIGKQGWNNQTLWYINLAPDGNTMAFGVGGERFILSDPFPTSNYSDMVISYEGFAHLTTGNRVVALRWLDGSQAMISDAGYIVSDSWGRVSSAPITPPSNAVYGQVIIASGAVASGGYSLFRRIKVEANQYGSATPYSDEATNGAIYRNGLNIDLLQPQEIGSNVTETRTAAAIANQAATATNSDFSAVTGTTKPSNNANNTYVDGNGAVQGVSSGAGTVIDNSYASTPNNLIPNSDQTSAMTMAQGYNPNGATFDATLQYASNVGGWVGSYILSGTTTRNLYVHQNNITAGGNDAIALDIYPTGSFTDRIPVVAGAKYIMSCYAQGHRCGGSVGLYFYNQAGVSVGDFASNPQALPYSGAATLSEYARLFVAATAPAGAASAAIYVRKHNTQAGNTESYFWLAAPQLERVNANATVPGPYVPGPALSTRQLGFSGELNADYTLTAQITTQPIDDVTINADYLGAIIAGQFNKITTPIVTKAGVSVRTDNRATYTATNITGGLTGYVTMNNTTGSADKGRATITNCTSSGSYSHNIFWDGVLIASYLVKFTVVAAAPPLGGGGSGGTGNKSGSFDSTGFTVSSTSFAVVGTITNLTKASGETIRCSFPSAEYQVNATTSVSRSIVAKWQYSPTGANSWTDVGSAVTGSASSWDAGDLSGLPGSITVNQNVAPSDAAYDLRLVAAMNTSGNSITFQFGTASVLIGV